MLIKKNVLNEIKKEHSLKASKTAKKSKGKKKFKEKFQNLDDLQNLLIKLTALKLLAKC